MKYIVILFLFLLSGRACAQPDTLRGVSIYGIPMEKYGVGQKVERLDSGVLHQYQSRNLAAVLSKKAAIYMKMYGNDMASTISLRGTGPGHTAVFWNGLEISSITLGQTDFSLIPVYVQDKIVVHYGSASALYGSGAIGGAISLETEPLWKPGMALELSTHYGSFSAYQGGVKASYSTENVEFGTKAYYSTSENDFAYQLPATGEIKKQNNAAYDLFGLSQDINIRLKPGQQILISGWLTRNKRALQPVIGDFNNDDRLDDQSLRVVASYHNNNRLGYFTYRTGYINDQQVYNEGSEIVSGRFINSLQFERKFNDHFSLQSGVKWNHIKVSSDNYNGNKEEERISAFTLMRYTKNKLAVSLNARQSFITGYRAPLAPSMGFEYHILPSLTLTGQLSRNYRVPTLNDRYWVPGGNPGVAPEKSFNAEIGAAMKADKGWKVSVNYYKMWVDDWIIWVPEGGIWSPENINKVNSEGVELVGEKQIHTGKFDVTVEGAYALNKAIIRETFDSNQRAVGKQLAYTPLHTASLSSNGRYQSWSLFLTASYTAKRFTDSNNTLNPLEGFVLAETGISKQQRVGSADLELGCYVNNLFDEQYQTLRNRAMPGRSYRINLIFNFSTL